MFRTLFLRRVRSHGHRVFQHLFPQGYDGEVFLCGGAFKPLLKRGASINDLDLWVRNRKEREKLCQALLHRGAHLLHDFHPYCVKFRLDGQLIEITYHNINDGHLSDVVNTFDLALCGMGVRYHKGQLVEAYVSDDCWHALKLKEASVLDSYFCLLLLQKTPSLIRTLHRMGQQAAELGFEVNAECEHRLWHMYWHIYNEDERKACMDLYFETMVTYKGQHNEHLMRRASMGYAPVMRPHADMAPVQFAPKVA